MIKIRVFSSFCEGTEVKQTFENMFESHTIDGYGTRFIFTNDDDYTHVVLLNIAMPSTIQHIPKERVIGFAYEPPHYLELTPEFVDYATNYIGMYCIGEIFDLPKPFVEHYSFMWHNEPLSFIPLKQNIMSIMISNKIYAPGHIYRHQLVNTILQTDLPIDIYGYGCEFYTPYFSDSRLKGVFHGNEMYESYLFHIAIENFPLNHYFSEKIINPLLCSTTPIYLGCKNIESYFQNQVIHLSSDIIRDIEILDLICQDPLNYYKNIDIDQVKKTTNLLLHIEDLFTQLEKK